MTTSAVTGYLAMVAAAAGLALCERLVALRNERRLRAAGAAEIAPGVFGLMVPVYVLHFPAAAAEALWRPAPPPAAFAAAMIALFAASKALKLWVVLTLGGRWTMRVLVPARPVIATGGPYRFVRHPNYVAVVGEIVSLALAGGAWRTALVAGVAFAAILRVRVRTEEAALAEHPAYAALLAGRRRFVP
jgi:methyltransferase